MRIAGIIRDSVVDGPGIRDAIFLQGCPHHCKGCHNPKTWNPQGGMEVNWYDIATLLLESDNDLTVSGGEPMDSPHLHTLLMLARDLEKDIWMYTGYTYEEIPQETWEQLRNLGVSVVVDGRYVEELRDSSLLFRGSSNQRLIDLKETLKTDGREIVLWEQK